MSWLHSPLGSWNTETLRYLQSAMKVVRRVNAKQDTRMNSCERIGDVGDTPIPYGRCHIVVVND